MKGQVTSMLFPAQVTESLFLPDVPESWKALSSLQREFTASCRGVRISGSAASNACALATGEAAPCAIGFCAAVLGDCRTYKRASACQRGCSILMAFPPFTKFTKAHGMRQGSTRSPTEPQSREGPFAQLPILNHDHYQESPFTRSAFTRRPCAQEVVIKKRRPIVWCPG